MSGLILCRSEYSKRPYYITGAAVNVYSLEEICYFLYNDIYLVGADFFCDALFDFIEKDIREPELAERLRVLTEQKAGLSECVLTILRYVDFYSEGEIEELSSLIERLDLQNVWERLKARADNYLSNSRYYRAISDYENIVYARRDEALGEKFYGDVWHNMGVAHARMMDFNAAAACFKQAALLNHSEETEKEYRFALLLAKQRDDDILGTKDGGKEQENVGGGGTPDDVSEDDELMYTARYELEKCMDGAVDTEEYKRVARVLQNKKDGQIPEYRAGVIRLIEEWQEEYRGYIK